MLPHKRNVRIFFTKFLKNNLKPMCPGSNEQKRGGGKPICGYPKKVLCFVCGLFFGINISTAVKKVKIFS